MDTSSNLEKILNTTLYGQDDSDGHLMTLFALALSIKAKNILELGVRYGTTTLPLLMAAKINKGILHSVDINKTEFIPSNDLSQYWSFFQQDAIKYLKECSPERSNWTWDLVLIDDWHSYDHVKKELQLLKDLVSPKSLIILHDTMYGHYEPNYHISNDTDGEWEGGGPAKALLELDKNIWEWATIPSFHGLTILRKI